MDSLLRRLWLGNTGSTFQDHLLKIPLAGSGAKLSVVANISLSLILAYTLLPMTGSMIMFYWSFAVILVTVFAFIFHEKNKPRPISETLIPVTLLEIAKGAVWLTSVILFFPTNLLGPQIFFLMVLVGTALSAAIARHMILPAALGAIGLALPATAVKILVLNAANSYLISGTAIIGWLCAIIAAFILRNSYFSRQRLLHDKELLVQSVENKMLELDTLRSSEKQARREAEAANIAKSKFLAQSSHDLRQPLHAINLLMETIPQDGVNHHANQILDRIRQSVEVLTGLFDSLLDIATLDTGHVNVTQTTFPAEVILNQVASEFSEVARANDVALSCIPSTVLLRSDPIILRRITQNLVSNAINHTKGGRVLIGVRRQKNTAEVEVHDTGAGIPLVQQEKIFEEFTRVTDGTTTSSAPGLGLGLAIVRRLADLIDVKVSVVSTVGVGSVFRILGIERVHEENQSTSPALSNYITHDIKWRRVAIIDDDSEILDVTGGLIKSWGFKADTYTEYQEGTFIKPDILLCDYELPGSSNGIEVIAHIRTLAQEYLPAILITGNTSSVVLEDAKQASVPILYKPVRPAQLRSALLAASADIKSRLNMD